MTPCCNCGSCEGQRVITMLYSKNLSLDCLSVSRFWHVTIVQTRFSLTYDGSRQSLSCLLFALILACPLQIIAVVCRSYKLPIYHPNLTLLEVSLEMRNECKVPWVLDDVPAIPALFEAPRKARTLASLVIASFPRQQVNSLHVWYSAGSLSLKHHFDSMKGFVVQVALACLLLATVARGGEYMATTLRQKVVCLRQQLFVSDPSYLQRHYFFRPQKYDNNQINATIIKQSNQTTTITWLVAVPLKWNLPTLAIVSIRKKNN